MTDIRTALEAFLRPWDTMSDEYLRSGAAAVEFGIETVGRVIAARAAISAASPEPEHPHDATVRTLAKGRWSTIRAAVAASPETHGPGCRRQHSRWASCDMPPASPEPERCARCGEPNDWQHHRTRAEGGSHDPAQPASPEPERCGCPTPGDDEGYMPPCRYGCKDPLTCRFPHPGCDHCRRVRGGQPAPAAPSVEALRDALLGTIMYDGGHLYGSTRPEMTARLDAIIAAARADERTRLDAPLTVEALAKEFIHIRGAHKGDYDSGEALGVPCEWCVLAAEQAVQAVAALAEQGR